MLGSLRWRHVCESSCESLPTQAQCSRRISRPRSQRQLLRRRDGHHGPPLCRRLQRLLRCRRICQTFCCRRSLPSHALLSSSHMRSSRACRSSRARRFYRPNCCRSQTPGCRCQLLLGAVHQYCRWCCRCRMTTRQLRQNVHATGGTPMCYASHSTLMQQSKPSSQPSRFIGCLRGQISCQMSLVQLMVPGTMAAVAAHRNGMVVCQLPTSASIA